MPHILPAEIEDRQHRCVEAMAREGIDCLVVLPGSNFTYLTGLSFVRERHRLLLALLTREGELALMGTVFEAAKMGSGPARATVETWTDEEDQYARVAAWIASACGGAPRLALEHTANYYHYLALRAAVPEATLADPAPVTDRLRAIKSVAEISCIREACARTRGRMERVPSQLEEGMTERDLAGLFGPGAMVQFGPTTSLPNEIAGLRELKGGDPIVIDAGDRVEGYRSDLTRTFFFGGPTARMREVYRTVEEAELAAIDAARPGAPAENVDLAARRVIERAGFGEFFTHRGGHGLGLDFHELPICVAGNREPLLPGMVLTAEPGIYLPGEFGVRLEDDLLITENGCELLSRRGPLCLD
jgi:Xaa-Pro dipeptidase